MARRDRTPIADAFARVLPREHVEAEAARLDVVQRKVKVDPFALVWALTLGFQVGAARTLTALRETYTQRAGHSLVPSGFYKRLSQPMASLMRSLALFALEQTAGTTSKASGRLAKFRDLLAIDSTVVRLHELLAKPFPGCRTNHSKAAAKLHMVMSVVDGSAKRVKLTGERTPDVAPWRRVGKWVEGRLLLFDLGYYRFHLFDRIDANGGFFLTRAKTTFNPVIVSTNRKWRGASVDVVGRKLRDVLPRLQREHLDVMVEVSFKARIYNGRQKTRTRTFRMVAVRNAEAGQYHCYLTNVPADDLPATDVRDTYALRWQVELLFKAMKSQGHLHQLPSRKKQVVECLVWAAVLATVVSQALHRLVRERSPADRHLPLLRWAGLFARNAERLLRIVLGDRRDDALLLQHLLREAPDPNRNRSGRAIGGLAAGLMA